MSGEGGNQDSGDEADSLLRAMAAAPPREPAKTPERIAHFRIVGLLGSGGMGIVYRAEDEKLRRTVALKVLPQAFANDAERRRRFLREARSAAALTHGNIAIVYEVDEDGGHAYIAMELVGGETLRERIARGPLPTGEAVRIARGITRGLVRAHGRGIVHRDLKPENVMVEPDGEPKILDFGLAKLRETQASESKSVLAGAETASLATQEGQLLGTPPYMSPEQASGDPVDGRGDVFSLGIVLYEMLSGQRPFGGRSTAAVLASILRDDPRPLAELAPGVPREVVAIVDRCLAKSPADRWPGARELLEALEAVPTSASVKSQVGVSVAATGTPRRRSWALGAAALSAVVAVVAAALFVRSHRDSPATAALGVAVGDAALHGIAMTDYPPPRGANPETAAAYAAALRQWREAELVGAFDGFVSICKHDPGVAAADLRVALYPIAVAEPRTLRDCYAAALQHRDLLDERDRLLLPVAEATVADPPVPPSERISRARAVVERFPQDAEARSLLGSALIDVGNTDEGRAELQRALDQDPQFAFALSALGGSYSISEPDTAIALLRRCLEISPSAGTCLRYRFLVYMDRGRCAEAEQDARRLTVIEPNGRRTFELFGAAVAARNAPIDTVRDALVRREALQPDEGIKRSAEVLDRLWLHTLVGDLGAAEKDARAWDALDADSLVSDDHAGPFDYLFDLLDEEGDVRGMAALADELERRSKGWTGADHWDLRMRGALARLHSGVIDEASLDRIRDGFRQEPGAMLDGKLTRDGWAFLYAQGVTTQAEAAAALPLKPSSTDLVAPADANFVGHVYLLAGQPQQALPHLRHGAESCDLLPTDELNRALPVWWMRAHVELGQALEQTGDNRGACAAYAVVLDRWKNAKPRSVSLEKARERSKALGCSR